MILRGMLPSFASGGWFPAADIYETPSALIVCVDISGMDPQTLTVLVEESRLLVSGERNFRPQEPLLGVHRLEIESGFFERAISLPKLIDPTRVGSERENGFLHLHLPLRRGIGQIRITVG